MNAIATQTTPDFTYDVVAINDLVVESEVDPKSGKNRVKQVLVKDEPLLPSDRFWNSLFARFSFNKAFFKYFDHAEVFERISDIESSDRLRVCVERSNGANGKPVNRLLAVSNPKKPIVPSDDLMEMLNTAEHEGLTYSNGIIESTHRPRVGSGQFSIMGDNFANRFVMATPVDGYGQPNVYLSLLREVCSNGMVAMSKTFKSQVALGKGDDNVAFALTRVLDQFGNDEGYAALRQRMESAGSSWASVNEAMSLYKMLVKLHGSKDERGGRVIGTDGAALSNSPYINGLVSSSSGDSPMGEDEDVLGSPIIAAFHNMTGDTSKLYGLANLDALSVKRQRTLPVKCKVYDMLNFATEVATHHSNPHANRKLQGWVGSLISSEYDMEGTGSEFSDFADFHVSAKFENNLTGSRN